MTAKREKTTSNPIATLKKVSLLLDGAACAYWTNEPIMPYIEQARDLIAQSSAGA